MQLQLRRRYTDGLSLSVNYTLAKNTGDLWADNATQDHTFRTLRDKSLDDGPLPFDVRHVFQSFGTYDLPIWQGPALLDRQSRPRHDFRRLDGRRDPDRAVGIAVPAVERPADRKRIGFRRRSHEGLTAKDLQKMIKSCPARLQPVLHRSEAHRT